MRLIICCLLLSWILPLNLEAQTFEDSQLLNPRVREAKEAKDGSMRALFEQRQLNWAPNKIYLRAFKHERILEVWVQNRVGEPYVKYRDYVFCEFSGELGPKRKQGDEQIPEGFYFINEFNPNSNYYLSLGINYPNPSDRKFADSRKPGGDIFIHGDCVTIGCIPLTDDKIMELYWLSVKVRSNGQELIPVHIFPYKFDRSSPYAASSVGYSIKQFWENLRAGYDYFNTYKQPPFVHINNDGTYDFF